MKDSNGSKRLHWTHDRLKYVLTNRQIEGGKNTICHYPNYIDKVIGCYAVASDESTVTSSVSFPKFYKSAPSRDADLSRVLDRLFSSTKFQALFIRTIEPSIFSGKFSAAVAELDAVGTISASRMLRSRLYLTHLAFSNCRPSGSRRSTAKMLCTLGNAFGFLEAGCYCSFSPQDVIPTMSAAASITLQRKGHSV